MDGGYRRILEDIAPNSEHQKLKILFGRHFEFRYDQMFEMIYFFKFGRAKDNKAMEVNYFGRFRLPRYPRYVLGLSRDPTYVQVI